MSKRILMTEEQIKFILDLEDSTYSRWLINEAILENMSINKQVLDNTNVLSDLIAKEINNKEHEKTLVEPGITKCIFYLRDYILFNNKFGITVVNYNFKDTLTFNKNFEKYEAKLTESDSIYEPKRKHGFIRIISCSISGGIVKKIVNDNIAHEIQHCFQEVNAESALPKDENYSKAYTILKSGQIYDELTRKISLVLYYSYSFEQDGFVNGLYQYLSNDNVYTWDDIKNTSAVGALETLRKTLEDVEHEPVSVVEEILRKHFGLSYKKFINFGKEGIKRFASKIGKVLWGHRSRQINEGVKFSESLKTPLFYFF